VSLPARTRVRAVVLAERVARGFDNGTERVEPGLRRLDIGERDNIDARIELDSLGGDQRAVHEQSNRRRLGDARSDLDGDREFLAERGRRRRGQPLDQHLVHAAGSDPAGLHLDALCCGECRFGLAPARRVVAVREQHDPLLGVVREEGDGEPEGGTDVGRRFDRRRGQAIDLRQVGWESLDERIAPEGHDAGNVVIGFLGKRLAQERERIRSTGVADRVGEIDDEHGRQAIDRQHELEAGQRKNECR
jgi:hypothetical protein